MRGNRTPHKSFKQIADADGFTLSELMIGLALTAILASLAVPNFRTMTQNSEISATTNMLVAHINRARSEAISRNVPVNLCRTTSINLAAPENSTCVKGTTNVWTTGWLVYTAPGKTSGTDDFEDITGAELLAFHQGFEKVNVISNSSGNQWLAINSDGSLNESGIASYAVCDDRSIDAGRLIQVSMTGRVSVSKTTSSGSLDCNP